MQIRKTKGEFMLLPIFSIDNWFMPELHMYQKVYTIGCMNERIGNAPTFNEAIDMIVDYAYKNYNVK